MTVRALSPLPALSYAVGPMDRGGQSQAGESDEALMMRYAAGDAGAFEALYRRHRGPLYRYLLRQTGSEAVAEELFQDIWLKVVKARARYEVRALFRTWLYRIAHNRLIDHYRRSARGLPRSYGGDGPDDPDDCPAPGAVQPEHRVQWAQNLDRLLELVQALPEAQREAFLLKVQGGLSVDEIAEATGVGRETAKSRLRYALDRLRRGLESET